MADYWAARARSGFWPTREISYRLGAGLAVLLGRIGLTPNLVSVMSLGIAVLGLVCSLQFLPGAMWQGVGIFLVLNLAYAFDCADGLLARVKGLGSRFGAFFDKFVDVCVMAFTIGYLSAGAGNDDGGFFELPSELGVAFALGARFGLCLMIWLNEFAEGLPDRGKVDCRTRDIGWWCRRSGGALSDQVVFIVLISVAWGSGQFWPVLWIYHGVLGVLALGYLFQQYRDGHTVVS